CRALHGERPRFRQAVCQHAPAVSRLGRLQTEAGSELRREATAFFDLIFCFCKSRFERIESGPPVAKNSARPLTHKVDRRSTMKADRIVTLTTKELEALFNLPTGPAPAPGQSASPQTETLAEPEAWVRDFLSDLESPPIETIGEDGRPLNEGQMEWATREKQREMLAAALPTAILALRKKLGLSQWEM